jgi:hypothetical protein
MLGSSLRQFTKGVPVASHCLLGHFHLLGELGIGRRESKPAWRLGDTVR